MLSIFSARSIHSSCVEASPCCCCKSRINRDRELKFDKSLFTILRNWFTVIIPVSSAIANANCFPKAFVANIVSSASSVACLKKGKFPTTNIAALNHSRRSHRRLEKSVYSNLDMSPQSPESSLLIQHPMEHFDNGIFPILG